MCYSIVIKHHDQRQLRRRGFILSCGSKVTLLLWDESEQKLKAGALKQQLLQRLMKELCFLTCSACFHVSCPWVAQPTMGWFLLYHSISRLAYCLILWRHFLSWDSLLSDDSSLCQVDIKLASALSPEKGLHVFLQSCSISMFMLLYLQQNMDHPRYIPTVEWIMKMWYMSTMESYSVAQKNDIIKPLGKVNGTRKCYIKWVNPGTERQTDVFSLICGS